MNLIRSYSHPELLVGSGGQIYRADSGERINIIVNHGLSTYGPIVCYRHNGKTKQVAVLSLVYECHVKKEKISKSDYYDVIDGDYLNTKADNIVSSTRYKKGRVQKVQKEAGSDYYYLNGHDEIFC